MTDLIDELIADWKRELPALDTGAMGLVGRAILLGRALEQRINELLLPYELIYTDFDVLATLRRSGAPYSLTPTALRRSVLLTSGAMTAALDRLEQRQLIVRDQNPQDRRSTTARLTQAGVALAEELAALRFKDAQDVAELLSPNQQSNAIAALKKLLTIERRC